MTRETFLCIDYFALTGGPAAQAGVRKGDSIIEVNGAIVSQINHKEVVQIIKCKCQLILPLWCESLCFYIFAYLNVWLS